MALSKSFMSKYREKIGSNSIEQSRYGEVKNWISTGSLALNRIISGSVKKGIPSGRVIILAGESQVGKSLIAATIISNAQKSNYDQIFYFDSEGGATKDFFANTGCNTDTIEQILVENIQDAQLKILETFNMIIEEKQKNPDAKFLCVLDSLGALVAGKVLADAEKGKVASEMGGRAKLTNNMMKALTVPCLKSDTSIIVLNHVYQDPASMFPSKIQKQGGGLGVQYMASIVVQCTKSLEKSQDKDSDSFYSGTKLRFYTVKNRLCRPSIECEIYLDFTKGFVNQFASLFDEAVRGGFITNPKQGYYSVPLWKDPEKLFRRSDLEKNKEVWKCILPEFDKWSQQDLKYKDLSSTIETGEEEIENIVSGIEKQEIAENIGL